MTDFYMRATLAFNVLNMAITPQYDHFGIATNLGNFGIGHPL